MFFVTRISTMEETFKKNFQGLTLLKQNYILENSLSDEMIKDGNCDCL